MRVSLLSFLIIGGLASHAAVLKADTIFSNIVGNCCGGYSVDGASFSGESLAEAFIPSADFVVTDVQVMVFQDFGFGGDPYFDVSLYSSEGGMPGSLIATMGTDLSAPAEGGMVTASGPMPVLLSGIRYWLVLTPFDSGTQVGWEVDGGPVLTQVGISSGAEPGDWSTELTEGIQFQIEGTPAPEPADSVLVAAAIVLMALLRVFFRNDPAPRATERRRAIGESVKARPGWPISTFETGVPKCNWMPPSLVRVFRNRP